MKGSRRVPSTTKRLRISIEVGMFPVFPTIFALGDSVFKLDVSSDEETVHGRIPEIAVIHKEQKLGYLIASIFAECYRIHYRLTPC